MIETRTTASLLAWAFALIGAVGLLGVSPARAQSITANLTDSFQSGNTCNPCGPFGTVTLTQVTADEVSLSLSLLPGEVFSFGGAGYPLLFQYSGSPAVTFAMVSVPTDTSSPLTTSDFTLSQAPPTTMADGTGTWNDALNCSVCGGGTSQQVSGSLSFTLTAASGISLASFGKNANGLYFASDIGVGSFTGDVAATTISSVPEPSTYALMAAGLAAVGLLVRRRKH